MNSTTHSISVDFFLLPSKEVCDISVTPLCSGLRPLFRHLREKNLISDDIHLYRNIYFRRLLNYLHEKLEQTFQGCQNHAYELVYTP